MEKIKFAELRVSDYSKELVNEVLESNWITQGKMVTRFEKEWGEKFGFKHNIATSSGTDAVLNACLALYEMGANPGDEVIVPALSFISTANAVRAAGFMPVFVDIEMKTLNINPREIGYAVTDKTVAILVVHTMGRICDMDVIQEVVVKNRLVLIEDACEAHGASYKGQPVGSWGDMSCFSFFAAHMVCSGEGGMVSTNNSYLSGILRSTSNHGRSGEYFDHPRFGLNSKMNDLEAAVAIGELKRFDETWACRREVVKMLREELDCISMHVYFSEEDEDCENCPHGFSITLKKGDKELFEKLTESLEFNQIEWKRNFRCIPTQHGAFSNEAFRHMRHPCHQKAEHVGKYGLHIGTHKYMEEHDVSRIVSAVKAVFV